MKNIILFLIAGVLSTACQKDESIGPADLLHQRWSILKTRTINDTIWAIDDVIDDYDLEYRPDGALIYRRNGQLTDANCCGPVRYSRTNDEIHYTNWRICPDSYCGVRRMDTITQLDNDLLELNDGYHIRQYRAVK